MRRRTVPSTLRKRLRSEKQKDVARKLQARKDEFDSKEGPNDEPEIEEIPEPSLEEPQPEPEQESEPERRLVDQERNRVVDDGSEGKTASETKRKKLSKAEVAAATAFAKRQLAKAGVKAKGNDAQVQAQFREANHDAAVKRQVEGKKRAAAIGASSALAARGARNKAELTAQAKARVTATSNAAKAKAAAAAKSKAASTVSAAKAKAAAKVAAAKPKVVTQTSGKVPTGVRVPAPAPAKPAPKPKKPPAKKVGGGRHII